MSAASRPALAAAGALAALLFAAPRARADRPYAAAGPLPVSVTTMPSSSTQIAAPDAGGPYPLLVASHGWSATGAQQLGWAQLFASYGFVVAVPTFPSPLSPDAQVDASIIVGLVQDLGGASAATYRVLPGKVGLEGHSAGGLATVVAAQTLGAAVSAVVLFDPVDNGGVGQAAYAALCAPILDVFAEPSSCNGQAGWRPFAASTRASVVGFDVVGSTHCDGENQDRGALCGLACGGAASPDRQAVYGSYAIAFFLARLAGDANAAALLQPSAIAADGAVANPLAAASTCATPSPLDAGASPDASSSARDAANDAPDASSSARDAASDASPSTSPVTPAPSNDDAPRAAPPASPGGCACRAGGDASHGARAPLAVLVALALALLARGRARARRA